MKFEVNNRFTGAVQFIAEIECDDDAPISLKLGLAVKWAIKARANLAYADLARANLAGANLARANLARANLADADLAGADLAGADLAGANLASLLIRDSEIPSIPKIDAVILAEIEKGGTLDMSSWHGPKNEWCGTTHCRAGWAIHCAGKAGYELQNKVGYLRAGAMIYRKSRPGEPIPWFFAPNDIALADIKKCAAAQRINIRRS